MVISGLHRITGLCLVLGLVLLSYWYITVAVGGDRYTTVQWLFGSAFGQVALFGWTFCLFFHLCNGIRHFFFDAGMGTTHATARVSGTAVAFTSGLLTVLAWLAAYMLQGGV